MLVCLPASEPHPLLTPTSLNVSCHVAWPASLILHGLRLHRPRRKVAMATSHALSMVMEWLNSKVCPVRYELDFSSVEQLVALLSSYLGAKMSVLSEHELRHLCTLLLKVLHVDWLLLQASLINVYSVEFPACFAK